MDDLYSIIRKVIRLLVIAIVVAVIANDAFRLITGFSTASEGLKAGMNAALTSVEAAPQNVAAAQSAAAAGVTASGAALEEFAHQLAPGAAVNNVRVSLAVSAPVQRSILAAPVIGIVRGIPAQDWYDPAGVRVVLRNSK
ncbi:hypothetical protein EG831_11520, partial [bacterium]|nr:hypothetical protein [bacterium]